MSTDSLHIAVIGGGVAGITVAHILQRQHHVTLLEKNGYIGGHTNTIVVNDARQGDLPIDTGFIVLNNKTYPLFHTLLRQLGVVVRDSDMSFGFYCPETKLQYSGSSFAGLFADRKNYFNPRHYRLLWYIYRFSRSAASDLETGALEGRTLGQYIQEK
ncbi:MAG: FAD-dependent oxidoreductase, partial [bacterium]|nr:FAD-dependent oxidoreductase [bacterium]